MVLRDPSGLGSLSIVMALAGQAAEHSRQAIHLYFARLTFIRQWHISARRVLLGTLEREVLFHKGNGLSTLARTSSRKV